ncbi:MAG: hypothetical protein IIA88_02685 [Bacteroidetes bacterium]|nr:hypothetical protein [Bacteroidota bacterium]
MKKKISFKKLQTFKNFLKNTAKLRAPEAEISFEIKSENVEEEIISKFQEENPSKFNYLIPELIHLLQIEKKEDETSRVFEDRLISESRKVIKV